MAQLEVESVNATGTITAQTVDVVNITQSGGSVTYPSTASNVNVGGVGVFKQKTTSNLEFRGINSGSSKISVTLDAPNNEIDLDVNEANLVHQSLSGAGTNTHAQIDSHISATSAHGVSGAVVGTTDSQTLTNKNLSDTTTAFIKSTDATAQVKIASNGGASTVTNLIFAQSVSRNITFPDATGTLVLLNTSDTLTNKTLTGSTNTIEASALRTSGSAVVVSAASPPTTGQVLTATSATTADWQTPSGGGSGTVTSVSVVTANGVSGSVATSTTTPAITLTLGAITPSSVAATGTVTGSNLSGTNTGDQSSVTGNAGTATALQTGRTINGVTFDGTANITVTSAAGTLTGTTLNATIVSSSLTSVGTITTGVWNGTAVAATSGGTGQTSYAVGDLLYASTTTALSKLADVATGNVLLSGGISTAPAWGQVADAHITAHTSSKITITTKGQLNTAIVYTDQTNTFGAFNQIFPTSRLLIRNPAATFDYTIAASAITAARTLTLPLTTQAETLAVQPVILQSSPADPTGTTSTTGLMMGIAGAITPVVTGRVKIVISGTLRNTTGDAGAQVQIRTGTGTAPANGAALTGTTRGGLVKGQVNTSGGGASPLIVPFSCNAIVTGLTVGTAIWIDIGVAAITAGTASVTDLSLSVYEL